jgi:hypothetical protein
MTHLVKAGKFRRKWKSPEDVMPALAEANFVLLPIILLRQTAPLW